MRRAWRCCRPAVWRIILIAVHSPWCCCGAIIVEYHFLDFDYEMVSFTLESLNLAVKPATACQLFDVDTRLHAWFYFETFAVHRTGFLRLQGQTQQQKTCPVDADGSHSTLAVGMVFVIVSLYEIDMLHHICCSVELDQRVASKARRCQSNSNVTSRESSGQCFES